jgi:hypothetical protein
MDEDAYKVCISIVAIRARGRHLNLSVGWVFKDQKYIDLRFIMSIISPAQQEALYKKYLAIYYAYKSDASFFTLTQSNTELTTVK